MESKTCRFCGGAIPPEGLKRGADMCRVCYYDSDAYQGELHATVLSAVRATYPNASIFHSGGGCFCIYVPWSKGRYLMITDTDGSSVPEGLNVPCAIGVYAKDDESLAFETCDTLTDALAAIDLLMSITP
jgi:hypothetical protein